MIYLVITSCIWAFSFGLIGNRLAGLDPAVVAFARLALSLLAFLPLACRGAAPRPASALKLLLLDATAAQGCRDRVTLLEYEILDDHQPFLDQGFPAIDLIDFDYGTRPGANDLWHTPDDTLDQLSADSLQMAGAVTLEMLRRIEDQDPCARNVPQCGVGQGGGSK